MPEKLSLKMTDEGLLALFALQHGPCRVTQCRVLAKDTSALSFAATCLSVHMHTLSPLHSHVLLLRHSQKLSVPWRGNKSFSKGMLLGCAAQTPWNALQPFHQRESSPLWISVECGGKIPVKQHRHCRGLWHCLQSQLQVSYHKPSIGVWLHKTKAEAVTPQNNLNYLK